MIQLLIFSLFSMSALCSANGETIFLGVQEYSIDFEEPTLPVSVRFQIANDISRVFAPLLSVSNIVDFAHPRTNGQYSLIFKDAPTYPEGFRPNVTFFQTNDSRGFLASRKLCGTYMAKLSEMSDATNIITQLDFLIAEIRSGAVTNWNSDAKADLLFVPPDSSFVNTQDNANNLAASLVLTMPFPGSILDAFQMRIGEDDHWLMPTKSTRIENGNVGTSFFLWIFDDNKWKVFIPSSLDEHPN